MLEPIQDNDNYRRLSFGLVFVMAVQIVALLGYLSLRDRDIVIAAVCPSVTLSCLRDNLNKGFTVTDQELLQKRTIFKQSLTLWKSNGHA
jgi:hypothetical protein